ncbi:MULTISPECIES: MBL fold metallo-hydrolase [unclassified Kitasatospora]|uniref:MBL fold metallo-hydrolase n=1 Tax=unclassified Kitasatospora TaxID=2633591 RepID=UPI0033E9C921
MNSPRFAPAGLPLCCGSAVVAFDGGPGAEPPPRLDAWLVTDEQAELRADLHAMAAPHELVPHAGNLDLGEVAIRAHPVVHTTHPAWGYRIETDSQVAVWAPEFWEFPEWVAGADLMFAEAADWDRPIRFRGGVGGHMCVQDVAAVARLHAVRRLVFAHIGRPCLRAMDAGHQPPWGEWGAAGRTYTPARAHRPSRRA